MMLAKDWRKWGIVKAFLEHLVNLMPLLKMKIETNKIKRPIPVEPHWCFAYYMLKMVSCSSLVIEQLNPELRNAICIFYLVLRALDTIVIDTSIPINTKVSVLLKFHEHINDQNWHFSCGTKAYKVLMDKFYFVLDAFTELRKSYQEVIQDIAMRMGAGMAKITSKEVDTIDDYNEYCHYAAGLAGVGLSKLFYASKFEDVAPDSLANSMGMFLHKTNIIKDYLKDINEIPKSRMFWPRQIWSNYVDNLEDLKYEENAVKAVQCLNDMVTNALVHAEDCLKYMSALKDKSIFRFCVIPQIMAIETLALCYNNVEVFRGVENLQHGIAAGITEQTKSMADVYGAFYDYSTLLESKVDEKDPNASLTLKRVDAIKKACKSSGLLNKRRFYVNERKQLFSSKWIMVIVLLLAVFLAACLVK